MQKKFLGALGMALVLMTGTMAMPVQVCAKDYQDREAILDTGFVLDTDYTLQLANPSEDISTTESYYYITGSSDPDDPLICTGKRWRTVASTAASASMLRWRWGRMNLCLKMERTPFPSPLHEPNPPLRAAESQLLQTCGGWGRARTILPKQGTPIRFGVQLRPMER